MIEPTGRPTPLKGGVVFFLLEGHPVLSAVFWAPGADTIPGGVLTMKHEEEKKPKKRAEISDDPVPAIRYGGERPLSQEHTQQLAQHHSWETEL